jgi:hypothetical protein
LNHVTSSAARTIANGLLVAAGAVAAYAVLTKPARKRVLVRGARVWLGASVPVYLANELRQARVQSHDRQTSNRTE